MTDLIIEVNEAYLRAKAQSDSEVANQLHNTLINLSNKVREAQGDVS